MGDIEYIEYIIYTREYGESRIGNTEYRIANTEQRMRKYRI